MSNDAPVGPAIRPRRLRQSPAMRRMVAQTRLDAAELVLPMFVREGIDAPAPVASMPGVVQHTLDSLVEAARDAAEVGVGGLMLFGVPTDKDEIGSGATDADGILNVALRRLRAELGEDNVSVIPPNSGSEDVGVLATAIDVPLVYWVFGGYPQEVLDQDTVYGNHSPHFAPVADPTLETGLRAALAVVLYRLGG